MRRTLIFFSVILSFALTVYADAFSSGSCPERHEVFSWTALISYPVLYTASNFSLEKWERDFDSKIRELQSSLSMLSSCDRETQRYFTRKMLALKQMHERIQSVRAFRLNPLYIIPVAWGKLNTSPSALPNAPRPYRANSTDAIHHGIDFYAPYHTPVIATSDAIVIRIVDGFTNTWFDRIQTGKHLTPEQMAKNLDIYRGNQVWIVSPEGGVAVYSHVSEVEAGLTVWSLVRAWAVLGKVGVSWVPWWSSYRNYHLHFELYPLTEYGAIPDPESVMLSDWKWKDTPRPEMTESIRRFFWIEDL